MIRDYLLCIISLIYTYSTVDWWFSLNIHSLSFKLFLSLSISLILSVLPRLIKATSRILAAWGIKHRRCLELVARSISGARVCLHRGICSVLSSSMSTATVHPGGTQKRACKTDPWALISHCPRRSSFHFRMLSMNSRLPA